MSTVDLRKLRLPPWKMQISEFAIYKKSCSHTSYTTVHILLAGVGVQFYTAVHKQNETL